MFLNERGGRLSGPKARAGDGDTRAFRRRPGPSSGFGGKEQRPLSHRAARGFRGDQSRLYRQERIADALGRAAEDMTNDPELLVFGARRPRLASASQPLANGREKSSNTKEDYHRPTTSLTAQKCARAFSAC